ncbi:MAG: hypothetical protein K9G58_02900 [Bacteroidales bacterium]|nr:hypothetical protein [Bacteroidales bacterium]MCF8386508.1 hypothetical protein [Bacteroidales bacterium]MCF8397088.1 hypothetical protein [Bacteroidales bacterium]
MRIIILLILFGLSLSLGAQTRKQYLGVRGGASSGVTVKIFKSEFKALEGLLSFRSRGVQLTALIETYRPVYLKHTDRVYFFSGLGAHVGYVGSKDDGFLNSNVFNSNYFSRRYAPVLGLDGIVGLEYRFREIPLVVAVDYKPFFELFGRNFFNIHVWDFGISIKYVFN